MGKRPSPVSSWIAVLATKASCSRPLPAGTVITLQLPRMSKPYPVGPTMSSWPAWR